MPNYYIISVGGTGARVVKSLMYMCIAQCFNVADSNNTIVFKVLCVDSDESNGELEEIQKLLSYYNGYKNLGFTTMPTIEFRGKAGLW